MKKELLAIFVSILMANVSFCQMDTVFYHTNHFTSQYGTTGALPTTDFSRIVTRFTPTISYPCKLVKMRAWFRNCINPSQFNWVVYKEPNGSAQGPGSSSPVYLSTGNYTNPAQGGAQDSAYVDSVDLTSQNIILTSGDVYAGVTEHLQQNMFIGISVDTANTSTPNRHWVYSGAWYQAVNWIFADASWGITAYFLPSPATSVDEGQVSFSSVQVFPLPASTEATFSYELKESSLVSISVINSAGENVVMNIAKNENQQAGNYDVSFSVSSLANGIYFVRLESNGSNVVKKLVVIK